MGYEQDEKPKFDVYIGGLFDGDYADFDDALKRADALMHDIGPDDEHGPEDILIQMVISESVYVPNGHVNYEGDEIMHYVHQPTAEWSRITQGLKERDELAAELERVKAERDELKRIVNEIWGMFYGQGLSVANWHQNGDLEPMEEFFEQNNWDPESCRAAHEGVENDTQG